MMLKVLLISVFLYWCEVAYADTFIWTNKDGGDLIISMGQNQTDAWHNLGASSISGYAEDGLRHFTLIQACRAPGWYAVFNLYDANTKRGVDRGVCGATSREEARSNALRSCQAKPECISLLTGSQTYIKEIFGFDSGSNSWLPDGNSLYPYRRPGEKAAMYRCDGNDPNNKGRDAMPYCLLDWDTGSGLPERKTRGQLATGQ